jgi:hypothetical protein
MLIIVLLTGARRECSFGGEHTQCALHQKGTKPKMAMLLQADYCRWSGSLALIAFGQSAVQHHCKSNPRKPPNIVVKQCYGKRGLSSTLNQKVLFNSSAAIKLIQCRLQLLHLDECVGGISKVRNLEKLTEMTGSLVVFVG